MTSQIKNGTIIGLALFAMFFGAGNLIFPTSVGLNAGDSWFSAMLGFLTTGVGLPLLGVYAVIKIGGNISTFSSKLGPLFSHIFSITIMTSLALVAISRTAATTFEMSVAPLFPQASPLISSVIFFLVTIFLAINPNGIIDRIGKILTPILLLMLSIIIIKGITSPIGQPLVSNLANQYQTGFFGGYQTMDALGSIMLGGIITTSLISKGYHDKKTQGKVALIALSVAGIGLSLVYGGLLFLGATGSSALSNELSRTGLTVEIVSLILGDFGKIVLGICVAFACLTTSVGLTATVSDYYKTLSNNKINYKVLVIATSLICGLISNIGVDAIVRVATPLLITIYPIAIVLIIINIINPNAGHWSVRGAVLGAFSISVFDGLKALGLNWQFIDHAIVSLPFGPQNLAWITPAILGFLIGMTFSLGQNKRKIIGI